MSCKVSSYYVRQGTCLALIKITQPGQNIERTRQAERGIKVCSKGLLIATQILSFISEFFYCPTKSSTSNTSRYATKPSVSATKSGMIMIYESLL